MTNPKMAAGQNISQRIMQDRFLLRVTTVNKGLEKSNVIPFPIKTLPSRLTSRSKRKEYTGNLLKKLFGFTRGLDQVVLIIHKEEIST